MLGDPVEALRARSLRVTPQRRAILAAFEHRPDEHLSADEVHARAAAHVPELGRGTVYATLAELTELGLLAALGSPEPVRYESNVAPHQHFRCRICLRLYDIDLASPSVQPLRRRGYLVDYVAVIAEGVCAQCRDYERGLGDGTDAVHRKPQLSDGVIGILACASHDGSLGRLQLAASDDGIARVAFEGHADYEALAERARTRRGSRAARERIGHAIAAIDAFLAGDRHTAHDVVDWEAAGMASSAALEATREIPFGATLSYERLGGQVGAYDCGYAMGANPMPMLLPCHRVTRGGQMPEEYVGGAERRRKLQELEHGH